MKFIPAATCDSVYYVDPHDRKTFINIDCYFNYTQESKLAELQRIAYAIGAKSFRVEMDDSTAKSHLLDIAGALNAIKVKTENTTKVSSKSETKSLSLAESYFETERQPIRPELCWFANDNNIHNLIEMRCSGTDECKMKTYTIALSGSNAASMSVSTATKIEGVVKGMGANCNFNSKSTEEHSRKMIFKIDF